jgi:hypothetical protein
MNALQKLLASLQRKFRGGSQHGEQEPHRQFPSLAPKRDRNRHSQREFRHRDRSLGPDPEAAEEE